MMNRLLSVILGTLLLVLILSFRNDQSCKQAELFFSFINAGNVNGLEGLLAKNFLYTSVYGTKKDREIYLKEFQNKLIFHPKMQVKSIERQADGCVFLLENSTDYNSFLDYPPFGVQYTIHVSGEYIHAIEVDSIAGHAIRQKFIDERFRDLEDWIQLNFPDEINAYKSDRYSLESRNLVELYVARKGK